MMDFRERRGYRRSERTRGRSGRETLSSKHRKLAQWKAAAEGSRRGHNIQEGGHNSRSPWDFGAREPQRATGKSPMVERRTSVNRSPCGRRTSLEVGAARCAPPCRQYTRTRPTIPLHFKQRRWPVFMGQPKASAFKVRRRALDEARKSKSVGPAAGKLLVLNYCPFLTR
jgi:hypothetical protein